MDKLLAQKTLLQSQNAELKGKMNSSMQEGTKTRNTMMSATRRNLSENRTSNFKSIGEQAIMRTSSMSKAPEAPPQISTLSTSLNAKNVSTLQNNAAGKLR